MPPNLIDQRVRRISTRIAARLVEIERLLFGSLGATAARDRH
ncbi:MAG TPA: hypothetical protein VNX29_17905 [Kaistia sp.]|nr:hypothetical protein [Kaistia sp.]